MIRVHVAHDHPVVRDALRLALGFEPDLAVAAAIPTAKPGPQPPAGSSPT